jgi:hypothetical protein
MRHQAVYNTHSNALYIKAEIAYDKNEIPLNLDEAKVQTEVDRLQAEYDALQYQRDRQYPSIGDQLDMQYHDELNGTTTWKDAVAKVKSDNPKG